MLVLELLAKKSMYGYEMIETLESRSNHVFSLKAGTLYPLNAISDFIPLGGQ